MILCYSENDIGILHSTGLKKAKSILCYTRQIMNDLGQRKQISNKKRYTFFRDVALSDRTNVQGIFKLKRAIKVS